MAKPSNPEGANEAAEQTDAQIQAAIEEASFDLDNFLKLIPRAAHRNEVDSYLRRSSVRPVVFPSPNAEDTATLADDDDDDAVLDLQARRRVVLERATKEMMRYTGDFEMLNDDLREKVDGLAKTFMMKNGNPAFNYIPLSAGGQTITHRGKMDLDTFRKLQYQVRWKGWEPDATWYPASDFRNAATALITYHAENPERPGPPLRLMEWKKMMDQDMEVVEHPDDEKAVPESSKNRMRRSARLTRK